ncbi:dehydrogenase reductase sdr family member 8 precursor [Diplodia corticola]|uniref:Short-chain dehydrogenase/reductase 3 n=1 Tax=Diplodia corticola TaxID=236234 RepID=A0A1J9RBI4_9PEZI|nr:dehydrogenase reductase sdr family member 8 precursor [Diplodia corticola]OJD29811.1 dehydrogenase reductase sdr family member 8 precursor [Diplodia corticola]
MAPGLASLVRSPLLCLVAFALTRLSNSHLTGTFAHVPASRIVHSALSWGFGLCAVLSCISLLNQKLSDLAHNKWLWDPWSDPFMRFQAEAEKWNWPEEIAVITGGSDGIGSYVAEGLASHGVKVAILDVQPPAERIRDLPNIHYYECDVSSQPLVWDAAEKIRMDIGKPSILINNAGIGRPYTILDLPPGRPREVYNVNVLSHFNTLQEFLPDMLEQKKGYIMSVASLASFWSGAAMSAYACSKAAVLALHETLNQELKHRYHCPQIKTAIVHPHFTRTKLIADFEGHLRKRKRPVSVLEPQDVAAPMVKLILSGKGGQVFIPESTGLLIPLIRGLPTWVQELLKDAVARNEASANMAK